tara:strand:- start:79 stop:306 length:228 start_codon:yes stop_codon:yes gene_type:complete
MELIKPNDPRYFTQTSNKSYDRHRYELVFVNGQSEEYDSWESIRGRWFEVPPQFTSHVNVLDLKQKKKKSNGGFK